VGVLATGAWTAPERGLGTSGGAGSTGFYSNNSHSRRAAWLAARHYDARWRVGGAGRGFMARDPSGQPQDPRRQTGRCQPGDDRRGTMLVRKR
jgi:hypothetical protein